MPVRIVQGGGGYGKTTLLSEWVRLQSDAAPAVFWVTVDEASNARVPFWRMVLGLFDAGGLGDEARFGTVEAEPDLIATLPAALLRGFESLSEPVVLVLDSYECLADTAVEADLLRLLRHTEKLQLVIGTRTTSTIETMGTELEIEPLVIDTDALRFGAAEVSALAEHLGTELTDSHVAKLVSASTGWPFAVRAALQHERDNSDSLDYAEPGIEFLRRNILKDLATLPGYRLLLLTSIVDSFTLEQAEFLGADPSHETILAEMEERGLGGWSDSEELHFRLHPMLCEVLRHEFTRTEAGLALTSYRRLAQWFGERDDNTRAFDAAVQGKDWALAGHHLRRGILGLSVLVAKGRMFLTSIPPSALRQQPLLVLFAGLELYIRGEYVKAVRHFLTVVAICETRALVRSRRPTMDELWVQGMLVIGMRLAGRYELVERGAGRLRRILEAVDDPDGELIKVGALVEAQLSTTLIYLDKLDAAAEVLAIGVPRRDSEGVPEREFHIHSLRAFVQASRGNIDEARLALETVWSHRHPKRSRDSFYAVPAHLAAALASLEDFDPDAAEAHLAWIRPHWSTMEHWPLAVYCRTRVQWQKHGPQIALVGLREGRMEKRSRPGISPAMSAMLDAIEAELLFAAGRGSEARAIIGSGRNRNHPRSAVVRARALFLSGRFEQAASTADRRADDELTARDRVHLLLLAASAAERMGDRTTSQERFDRAVELACGLGLRTPFAMMPRSDFLTLSAQDFDLRALVEQRPEVFPDPGNGMQLTAREQIVLNELAGGSSLAEIAETLSVAVKTVKNQSGSLYRKLGVSDRGSAVAVARQRGLL